MNDHFRQALEELDIELVRKLMAHVMPHLPQPANDDEALISAHMARTAMRSIRFKLRAYSHAWLRDRSLPSQLPDELRPRAERMFPEPAAAVGIAVYTNTPVALAIRRAMEEAVLDVGVKHPPITRRAILAARSKVRRQLLGIE